MTQFAPTLTITPLVLDAELVEPAPLVLGAELVDLDALTPQPLQYPPAVRPLCACGKDGTLYSHGGRTCAEVMELRAGIVADSRRVPLVALAGGGLVAVTGAAAVVALVALVVALVAVGAAAVAWLAAYWPVLAGIAVILLLLGGGAKCAGLHCSGCSG